MQGNSKAMGEVEVAIWYCEKSMTVHITKCRNLPLKEKSARHYYVQAHFMNVTEPRKITPIASGMSSPEFNTQIQVGIYLQL